MSSFENQISEYIDALNAEQEPEQHRAPAGPLELENCLAAVRLIRSLKEPAWPGPAYPQKLVQAVSNRIESNSDHSRVKMGTRPGKRVLPFRHRWILPAAALIASLFLIVLFTSRTDLFKTDVVYAMEKAVAQLSGYRGVLQMNSKNAAGEEWLISQTELWSEGDKYAVRYSDGTMTVNNGERKWQIRPQSREAALLPLVPDSALNGFDLRDEAERAMQYPHRTVGQESIAGRPAEKLEISPPGGLDYYLWIDKESKLPVQLQTAMQNALQTTYTFVSFEANVQIDPQIFAYQPPTGYKVVEKDPGQLVATVEEAAALSQVTAMLPKEAPARIFAFRNRIVLDYGDSSISETTAQGAFEPVPNSALGKAAGGPLEVLGKRLRWRQNGLEIQAEGPRRVELARQITSGLTLPDAGENLVSQGSVKVPVDMETVKTEQQQVDAGHGPWQLDPLQVALTFVNLKVSPQGIVGEPEIGPAAFKLAANNGVEAIVEVDNGPVKKVYLKRLIRQDETGIWSVVAYDSR